ncbi:Putative acetyltransferase [Komagataella phaffii CBS 7435]|uniref:Maltose/galactoside acetyltransferase domain-containing protein n=2 Tax=Komagataella phaffii TaxID=460519 RepID=C4QZ51_KOMPG|nr:Hypothetical protein PAS_c121_0012 [Komagataella phaffii GS115]AOA61820.1 GQ67_01471T0 [Komagataella phaffii]CAH2447353.1 Putative acetyltransferase [Komagataella phaffii CBS 7435]AOA66573.1 GQ68_01487T0 [Komagataella phaffii GS115]CAY68525.1 Hypothetical protein PAS_c121_0012 [Komagataella phaffii GS115]CCA37587.1 Putative acetyltransferase [Komagataella phaffii CBS 7435]
MGPLPDHIIELCKNCKAKNQKDQELINWANETLRGVPKGNEEWERGISGMLYDSAEPDLLFKRFLANDKTVEYGEIKAKDHKDAQSYNDARSKFMRDVVGHLGSNSCFEYPFFFDYGFNTYIGDNFFANFNLTILDCSIVKIGNGVMCGPNVSIITATHPLDPTLRKSLVEYALPITIEDNVWLSSNCVVLPGVTVGKGSIVAAGAVVSKDVPPYTVVAGVPAKVVKSLEKEQDGAELEDILAFTR